MNKKGFKSLKAYAIDQHVHDGQQTMSALYNLYLAHKGSHYKTIVALFKAQGVIHKLKEV